MAIAVATPARDGVDGGGRLVMDRRELLRSSVRLLPPAAELPASVDMGDAAATVTKSRLLAPVLPIASAALGLGPAEVLLLLPAAVPSPARGLILSPGFKSSTNCAGCSSSSLSKAPNKMAKNKLRKR